MAFAQYLIWFFILPSVFYGCSTTTVYEPVGYDHLFGKRALVLEAVSQQPLDKSIHNMVVDSFELQLSQSPNVKKVLSRADFRRLVSGDALLLRDYNVFSETLAVVGVTERTLTRRIGAAVQVDILVLVQPLFVPCNFCEDKNRFVLTGHVVDVESGHHLWRANLQKSLAVPTPESIEAAARELNEKLLDELNASFQPKWHRLRFEQLAASN